MSYLTQSSWRLRRDDLRTAMGFLTRIPVGRINSYDPSLGRAGAYFLLVGAVVGAAGAGGWWLGTITLGPLAGAVVSVMVTIVLTGAIHEDGLADTADGLWGGSTPARRLDIMRDSRIGTYGLIAVCGDVLLRVAVLAPYDDLADVVRLLVAGHVIGRTAPLVLAAAMAPARPDGQGVRLVRLKRRSALIVAATVIVTAVAAARWWAPAVLIAAAVPVMGLRRAASRRIGGVTGDVLGASVLLTNLSVAVVMAALAHRGLLWGA